MDTIETTYADCAYCNATLEDGQIEALPGTDDDAGWAKIAEHHGPDCEWVRTRSFAIEAE